MERCCRRATGLRGDGHGVFHQTHEIRITSDRPQDQIRASLSKYFHPDRSEFRTDEGNRIDLDGDVEIMARSIYGGVSGVFYSSSCQSCEMPWCLVHSGSRTIGLFGT